MALAAAGVPFRVIPGVTAGLAALAAAAIPATLRGVNRAVIFAAGHGADEDFDWAPLARAGQPIVLYMVMHNLEQIAAALMAGGLAPQTPAAVIASATTPKERVLISTLEKLSADAPRAEIRAAGDRGDRRDREFTRDAARRDANGRERREQRGVTARGLIIAAPHSGAGKTTVTLALLAALRRRGVVVRAAKAGPDYIDPAFHAAVTGFAERQSRFLGDVGEASRRACRAGGGRRRYLRDRRRDGLVRRRRRRPADAARRPISPLILACRSCSCSMSRVRRSRPPRWCAALPRTIRRCASPASSLTASAANGIARSSPTPLPRSAFRYSAHCPATLRWRCRSAISASFRPASMLILPR